MYEKIEAQEEYIYERLDQLEGCEDNPVYAQEIKELKEQLTEINAFWATELF